MSEANRQTKSKDPYHLDTTRGNEGSFRIVVRFLHQDEIEHRLVSSREVAASVSPGRKPWVAEANGTSPVGTAPLHESSRIA